MTSTVPTPFRLSGISPKSYEHPADRAATAALRQIPYIDQVVRKLFEFGFERAYRQGLIANGIRIGPKQLPAVWSNYQECFRTLDMEVQNDLYILQTPEVNAMAFGADKPLVILNSGLVGMLDDDELKSVIAHEVGLNVDAFIQQATEYEDWDDSLDRAVRFLPELSTTHPFAVRRVSELLRWIRSGEYERILGGVYVRRGQEPPPNAEFARAVDHYASSFSALIQEAGGGVQQVARSLSDWLRSL
jgi:Zn-dependent protease with chaperone function